LLLLGDGVNGFSDGLLFVGEIVIRGPSILILIAAIVTPPVAPPIS
jgi:hypothetical protein